MHASRIVRRRPQTSTSDLCTTFCALYIAARGLSTSVVHRADGGSNNATPNPMHSAPPGTTKRSGNQIQHSATQGNLDPKQPRRDLLAKGAAKKTVEERAAEAARNAKEAWEKQQQKQQKGQRQGGLAQDSIFADDDLPAPSSQQAEQEQEEAGYVRGDRALTQRSPVNMAARLDPNPTARARWARKMVIRSVKKRGRLTREMRLARTERQHTSKSRFFKTSMKKLAPLARQIAGKSLDEAILQMRFSGKKAAREVHKHLIQARNEAIVAKGMGIPTGVDAAQVLAKGTYDPKMTTKELIQAAMKERVTITQTGPNKVSSVNKGANDSIDKSAYTYDFSLSDTQQPTQSTALAAEAKPEITDASNTPALLTQNHSKSLRKGIKKSASDIYIDQAWVNRGPYGQEGMPRARGRMDRLKPPYTGISVLLKEEKTREREKKDKEMKELRKRMSGKLWNPMPDRPITKQSQYVLW